jgi:hypothetical protein
MAMRTSLMVLVVALIVSGAQAQGEKPRPLMKDFMGLNVHSKAFEPGPFRPVCEMVRDYHNLVWDVGKDPATPTRFPKGAAAEGEGWLNWDEEYGSWVAAGFRIDACVQWSMGNLPPSKWTDIPKEAYTYGKAFADCFGSKGLKLVESTEIGNEPGSTYDDKAYHEIFKYMAKGLRDGDPAMKILTCAVNIGGDKYSKPLAGFLGAKDLFDVINVHQYALKVGWPTWERSFPEDTKIKYVSVVRDVINYRNQNLPGKEVWLTEFGYDASTKSPAPTGDFAKWKDVKDPVQANYIVRSFLVFSALDLDRAYLYYFNDEDEPIFHGSSGIMRHSIPKPSFYAMRHLYKTLGEYRFSEIIRKDKGELFEYDYVRGSDPKDHVIVAWKPTDSVGGSMDSVELPARPLSAERMPMTDDTPPAIPIDDYAGGRLKVEIDGSPVYIRVRLP